VLGELRMCLTDRLGETEQGGWVYVRDRQPFVIDAAAYLAPAPGRFRHRLLTVETVVPPSDIADGLRLESGATAVVRTRVLFHDNQPVELAASYYPAEIATSSSLAKPAKIRGGAPEVLADLASPCGPSSTGSRHASRPWRKPTRHSPCPPGRCASSTATTNARWKHPCSSRARTSTNSCTTRRWRPSPVRKDTTCQAKAAMAAFGYELGVLSACGTLVGAADASKVPFGTPAMSQRCPWGR